MTRKRDNKGSLKHKLSLDKLMVEYERKKAQLRMVKAKQAALEADFVQLNGGSSSPNSDSIKPLSLLTAPVVDKKSKEYLAKQVHSDFLAQEMVWMCGDFDREAKKKKHDSDSD